MKTKTYITVCKQTIAQNRKLPHEKQVGPIRISKGQHGKPQRVWGLGMQMHEGDYVSVCYANPGGPLKQLPWGARVWIQVTRAS